MRYSFVVIILAFCSERVEPQTRFVHLGAKAAAMGGAFTGLADGPTGFYWNPAGLAFDRFSSTGLYVGPIAKIGDARSSDAQGKGFSVSFPFMGFAFTRLKHDLKRDESLSSLVTDDFVLTLLQSLPIDNLVVAANIHYLRGMFLTEGESTVSSWDVDVGVMYEPHERMRFGVTMQKLREARFQLPDGRGTRLRRHIRGGGAIQFPRSVVVTGDLDLFRQGFDLDEFRELSMGVEKAWLDERLFVRAGLRTEITSSGVIKPVPSFGIGIRVLNVDIDTAYRTDGGHREEAFWVNLSLAK